MGQIESLALPFASYKLAFTPGLLQQVLRRNGQALLSNPADVLGGQGNDRGGYVDLESNAHWWIPLGHMFYSPTANDPSAAELTFARAHFFLPHRYRDPFHAAQFNTETAVTYDKHTLLVSETRDARANTARAHNDYRVLAPQQMTDPNGNRSEVAFDALGLVVATAVKGKVNENLGDLLEDFDPDPPLTALQTFAADPHGQAASMLGKTASRIVYDLDRFQRSGQPPFAATLARETHFFASGGPQTKIQVSFSYADGFGREVQKKLQAERGNAPQRGPNVTLPGGDIRPGALVHDISDKPIQADAPQRWVGNGRMVFNNKGKPVKQYEPFFSSTHLYEEEREMTDTGVSPILFYDPVERIVATLHPNHTYEKVVFDPWQQVTFDVNDTIAPSDTETGDPRTDEDINGYVTEYFKTQPNDWQTWREQRVGNQMGTAERDAAQKAVAHANTPTIVHFDALGRTFLTLADNGPDPAQPGLHVPFVTRVQLDIEGNQRDVFDTKDRAVMHYDYDMLGTRIHQASMEAGERWMLNDVAGKPMRLWDSRGFMRWMTYDELRRPTGVFVSENGTERLAERTVYGESLGDAHNHRTRVHQGFDGAGVVTSEDYDFKGNLLKAKRELTPDYKQAVNWLQNPVPNAGTFITTMIYDALNRPVMVTTPDQSVYRATFNEANLLDKVDVNVRGAVATTPFVTNINYNAKGQRELIVYGNGAETTYIYDPLTFRLTNLQTTRTPGQNSFSSQIFTTPAVVQDIHYTYDPAGNVMRIADDALPVITNNNQQVAPVCAYTYDATYRLTEATGREHIGQTAHDLNPQNRRDYDFVGLADFLAHPNDLQAMRTYIERYEYDAVGNFQLVRHIANGGSWNRRYEYDADSLLEPTTAKSNRLTKTTLGNGGANTETYGYADATGNDVHGCFTSINTMTLVWDCKDQLQRVDLAGGGTAYYVYDASGQRVRKVIEIQNGTRKEERIYLGGFEVYREYNGNGQDVKLERETLYVTDDKRRISLVETKTIDGQVQVLNPTSQIRYQLGNHLGSASLELDKNGGLISYEEYHPFGTTAFQAMNSAAEVSLKRYRYTGKERDEETGFSYHGARYYAPWIGMWTSCDPTGVSDDSNLYRYVRNNPLKFIDPTGAYHESVHYYTTFYVAMASGYSFEDASKIATYANLPDEWKPLDSETYSARESSFISLVRGSAESPNNLPGSHGSRMVNEGVHAFDSGESGTHTAQQEQAIRQKIVASTARDLEGSRGATGGSGDEKTFAQLGLAVHALGDSYAHSRLGKESERYSHVAGHGGPGAGAGILTALGAGGSLAGIGVAIGFATHSTGLGVALGVIGGAIGIGIGVLVAKDQIPAPDNPGRRPKLFGQYVEGLMTAFQDATGKTSGFSAKQRDDFIRAVTSTENEDEQIKIIRAEFKKQFGRDLPAYAPEKADAGPELSNIPNVTRDPEVLKDAARANFTRYQEAIRR